MRKLLNTIYITNDKAWLSLDGETLICKVDDEVKLRIPFDNIEAIVCFSYVGCSPALMGKCVEKCISLSFISPTGKFYASVGGAFKGNVFLRVKQVDLFRELALNLAKNTVAAKVANCLNLIARSKHDIPSLRTDSQIIKTTDLLKASISHIFEADSIESLLGIEGNCAKEYFSVFEKLLTNSEFHFSERSKRPPLDNVNAVLSFVYTIYTNEYSSALDTVGLDSYFGYYHSLRSGRKSLACDLVEESRCLVERFTLSIINLGIIKPSDFEIQPSGAVFLNEEGRKKVLTKWQEKKRSDFNHPYLKQKIPFGLIPYVQCNLMAKFVRGDIQEYPCLIIH